MTYKRDKKTFQVVPRRSWFRVFIAYYYKAIKWFERYIRIHTQSEKKQQHTTKHKARIDAKHVYFVHWRSWFGDMSTEHTQPIERNSEIPKSKWKHLNSIVSWFNDAQNFWLPENQLTNIIYAVSLSARRHSSFKWKNTFQDERKVFRLKYSNAIGRCE